MSGTYWRQVIDDGLQVPTDRPLDDLTAELTSMLGSPDADLRDGIAYPTLATWVERGVYDDLLTGLGDGMAAGLTVGLGEEGTDTVFRRSFSVLVLAGAIARDTAAELVPATTVLRWGDQVVGWYLRERDLRGWVGGKGWAHAGAHGADAVAALAGSRHLGVHELTVLLDVLADRVIEGEAALVAGETDRMAAAVMAVLGRGLVPMSVVEPWLSRLAAEAGAAPPTTGNAQQLLRSLYLLLAVGPDRPPHRADLVLATVDALRATNALLAAH